MTNEPQNPQETDYTDRKGLIRHVYEGYQSESGGLSAKRLWTLAQQRSQSASDTISETGISKQEIDEVKGDVLAALVALEMAEERLDQNDELD